MRHSVSTKPQSATRRCGSRPVEPGIENFLGQQLDGCRDANRNEGSDDPEQSSAEEHGDHCGERRHFRRPADDSGQSTNINAGAISAVSSGSGDAYGGSTSGTIGADPRQLMEALIRASERLRSQLSADDVTIVDDTLGGLQREIERPPEERSREGMMQRTKGGRAAL